MTKKKTPADPILVWNWGDKSLIAKLAKISVQYFNAILHGKRRPSYDVAIRIEKAAARIGKNISAEDVIFGERSFNPLIRSARR